MRSRAALFLALLALAAAFATYRVSYEVEQRRDRLTALNAAIAAEAEAVRVLRAEWDFLNQPDRLADLAERHLGLAPGTPGQLHGVTALDALPFAAASQERNAAAETSPIPNLSEAGS